MSRTPLEIERAEAIIERYRLAESGPTGTWAQRWLPRVCKHTEVRCTHADEIIARGWRRRLCVVCGRVLDGPMPRMCWFTGEPHLSTTGASDA